MTFEGFPVIMGWELTLACNLTCAHCGSSAGEKRKGELTLEESLAICDQFPPLLVQQVNFTGGEPLLHPDWTHIARRLRELEIETRMVTNGLLLTSENIEKMKDVGLTSVGVSIDGLADVHDRVRGRKGVFRQAMDGIERALNASIGARAITTVTAANIGMLPQVFEVLRSAGVSEWQVQPLFLLGRGKESDLGFTDEQYLALGSFVRNQEAKGMNGGPRILTGDSYGYYTEFDERTPPWRGCNAGISSCGITSDGRIKGCLSLPDEITEGSLRENDLWDIWFHPDSFAYTRGYSREKLGEFCVSCEYADDCRGGCSAMSYGSTGVFHNDPCCFHGIRQREQCRV